MPCASSSSCNICLCNAAGLLRWLCEILPRLWREKQVCRQRIFRLCYWPTPWQCQGSEVAWLWLQHWPCLSAFSQMVSVSVGSTCPAHLPPLATSASAMLNTDQAGYLPRALAPTAGPQPIYLPCAAVACAGRRAVPSPHERCFD